MNREIRKLLFVSDAPHFGGAERYVANMVGAARRRGMASTVCWIQPASATGDVFAEAQGKDGELLTVPAREVHRLSTLHQRLRSVIRETAPDVMIVNACGRPRFWAVPWVGRFERVPSLWVHHMVDHNDYRRLAPNRFGGRVEGLHAWRWPQAVRHRLAASASTAVIALNEADRDQIAREQCVRPRRIHVVSNGIDTEQYRFDPKARIRVRKTWAATGAWEAGEPFVVGTAGRLVHGKGMEMLLQAAAAMRSQGSPVRVVIAGDGPDRQRLISIAAKLGVSDSTLFLGHVDDMPSYYSGLDAFALCSMTESFGLVLAEAMSCERAAIATPTAGARTQIDNGLTGIVLSSFSADDLADWLSRLYRQPHLVDQLGHNARGRAVRDFSVDAALQRTLNTIEQSSRKNGCAIDVPPGLVEEPA
jgi:glycosyltransferase involved in cell wall biosynthesis